MPKDNKSRLIQLRITAHDYDRLLDAAGDMTLSAYLRAVIFGEELKKVRVNRKPLKDDKALVQLLGQIQQSNLAPNINQIAKAVNCGMVIMPDEAIVTLEEAKAELQHTRSLLMQALGKKA